MNNQIRLKVFIIRRKNVTYKFKKQNNSKRDLIVRMLFKDSDIFRLYVDTDG